MIWDDINGLRTESMGTGSVINDRRATRSKFCPGTPIEKERIVSDWMTFVMQELDGTCETGKIESVLDTVNSLTATSARPVCTYRLEIYVAHMHSMITQALSDLLP